MKILTSAIGHREYPVLGVVPQTPPGKSLIMNNYYKIIYILLLLFYLLINFSKKVFLLTGRRKCLICGSSGDICGLFGVVIVCRLRCYFV
nr:MAG TPA: Apo-citrate lyase phosphoribosyl-dephospho-CoA transferase [Caudoviricetes sp.]